MLTGGQTERIRRVGITLGAALLYLAVFFGLRDVVGQGVESLVVIPVIVTAVFWGWSAGLVAALVSFPINLILVSTATSESAVALIEGGAAARHVLVLLVGGGAGKLAELGHQFQIQVRDRRRAQYAHQKEVSARALLASIGRVMSSSLDLEESFASFAQLVSDLVPHHRIIVAAVDLNSQTITRSHVMGGRKPVGEQLKPQPLSGTIAELCLMADETVRFGSGGLDTESYPDTREMDGGMRSSVTAVLQAKGVPIGTLTVCSISDDAYDDADAAVIEQIADQVAGAVANAGLHADLQAQTNERAVLSEVSKVATITRSLPETLDAFYEALKMIARFDHFSVATHDESRARFEVIKSSGTDVPGITESTRFIINDGDGMAFARAGDSEYGEVDANSGLDAILAESQMRSWVVAPLRSRDRLVGVLCLASTAPDVYYPEAVELIDQVSSQVAPAIDNTLNVERDRGLFSRLEEQNWDLLQARATVEAKANELRDKNEELERAARLKTDFTSMVSHELRTPLTIINGFTEYFATHAGDTLTDQQMEFVRVMLRNGSQLARLVDDLLDVARLDSGKYSLERESLEASTLVSEVIEDFATVAEAKSQRINADVPRDVEIQIHGDRSRIVQVMTNLLSNASKYSEEGDSIDVTANRRGPWYEISVRDYGLGIKEEDLEKIFNPFYRADELKSQNVPGTGLGLVIAKSIIVRHGGSISVESVYGEGAVFKIRLPVLGTRDQESIGDDTTGDESEAA